jgi:glycosyltransferase involved in cell wall biosynthesis
MGLEPNFLFLGARRDVPELLACCDLSVLPSESEGLPNSVLEAMAAGLAVVATSVGGVPELIENEVSGLLVPPNNPSALSTAILRLLQDESLRQRLSSAGRDCVVTRFSFPRLVETLETLYSKVPEPVPFRREMPAAFEG